MNTPDRPAWIVDIQAVAYETRKATDSKPACLVACYLTSKHQLLTEYIGVEAAGFGRVRAEMWWAAHCPGFLPATTDEAFDQIRQHMQAGSVRRPIQVLVEHLQTQRFPTVATWRFQ